MKKIAYFAGGIAAAASITVIAGSLTVPNSFQSGTTISSSQMNANFTAVKSAVDDNDSRITALESANGCPSDMVPVGPICVDIYEASVWDAATGGNQIADLTTACDANGNSCSSSNKIYARSVSGVMPAVNITWFQAQQACANVGKRLLTNAEWQMAAAGTDTANCNNSGGTVANTDANSSCQSSAGVVNMDGNVNEWVADWVVTAGKFGTDADQSSTTNIKAIYRGGGAGGGSIFTYNAAQAPNFTFSVLGFRCAK